MYVCMHVCMYVINVCMYVCTYVRTYVCMYVCMYRPTSTSMYEQVLLARPRTNCTYKLGSLRSERHT